MKKIICMLTLVSTNLFGQGYEGCPTIYADPYTDCRHGVTFLNATPGFDSYSWSPAGNVSNPNIANPTTTIPGSYTVTATVLNGPELTVNGDFSAGYLGFISGQTYSSVYSPCNYFVGPGWFSSTLNPSYPDHTPTADNMFMSVDGCSPATLLWEETMSITPGANYTFSFCATKAHMVQPNFEVHFIGDVTGDNIIFTQAGTAYPGYWDWETFLASCWNAGPNSTVTIQVINLQTNGYGNDFGMDDFSFRECCTSSYTVFAPTGLGMNLFTNGDFSAGNTGFTSGHNYLAFYNPCNYYVGPGWFSNVYDPNFPDNTPTADNMFMQVDGCSPPTVLWEETIPVTQFTTYKFDFFGSRADYIQPIYEMHFIGNASGDVIVNTQTGIPYTGTWLWDQYGVACWNSGKDTKVTVRIINLETNPTGNDFGLDDFSFRQCCNPEECCKRGQRTAQTIEINNAPVNAFDVYPNPGNGNFEIRLDHPVVNAKAELINVLGERVDAFTFSGNAYKYTPHAALPKGIYMLRIAGSGETLSKQIIVQ